MLKDVVITKEQYEAKMIQIQQNTHLIEEAVENPEKMKELESTLGIVK